MVETPSSPLSGGGWVERDVRAFAAAEWRYGLHGMLFASGCEIVNDPFAENSASFKPLQLEAARRIGLRIDRCVSRLTSESPLILSGASAIGVVVASANLSLGRDARWRKPASSK